MGSVLALPIAVTLPTLSPMARALLEEEVERLIFVLDALDGDADIEDDDPAGGNPDDEGEPVDHWDGGSYGEDQSKGPLPWGGPFAA